MVSTRTITWLQIALFVVVMAVLWYQSFHYLWRGHLQGDVSIFFMRATHFLDHSSWANMPYNEYLPGALWFFVAVLAWVGVPVTPESYSVGVFLLNTFLLIAHFAVYWRYGSRYSLFVFSLLLLAAGPILLFRFEALVALLSLWAWVLFARHKMFLAAFFLGLATAVKIYPVVLLPFLFVESWRLKQFHLFVRTFFGFGVGFGLPLLSFVATGGTGAGIVSAFSKHGLKPIGLEGLWGNIVALWQIVDQGAMHVTASYGIHGLYPPAALSLSLVDRFWIIPCGAVSLLFIFLARRQGYREYLLPFAVLLTMVLFAKVINPQYLWWFVSFLPLVRVPRELSAWYWILVGLSVMSLVLTQYVFPIHYTEFLDWFYTQEGSFLLIYSNFVRNLMLVGMLGVSLIMAFRVFVRSSV